MQLTSAIKRLTGRLVRDESGTATIEFVIMFPLFMTLFLSSIEIGIYLTRSVLLERALDINVRALRLEQLDQADAYNELKTRVCDDALIFRGCPDTVLIELTPIPRDTWALPTDGIACVDRSQPTNVPDDFDLGTGGQIMLIRACAVLNPFFGTTPLVMDLPKDATGGVSIVAASTYVNEP